MASNMSLIRNFDEYSFRNRVTAALNSARTILDNTRTPEFAANVPHEYQDKYILAEFLTNSAIASMLTSLEKLGLNEKNLGQLKNWAKNRSVTLRFKAEQNCKFIKKTTREVESDTKNVTSIGLLNIKSGTVTTVTEYFWNFEHKWEIIGFVGDENDKGVVLQRNTGSVEIKTSVESTPRPASAIKPSIDVNITWLLNHIEDEVTSKPNFSIDRTVKSCRTPRRNVDISRSLSFFHDFHNWSSSIQNCVKTDLFAVQSNLGLDQSSLNAASIFVPVLPIFEKPKQLLLEDSTTTSSSSTSSSSAISPVLPPFYLVTFLCEQSRSFEEKFAELDKIFAGSDKLLTVSEAKLLTTLLHTQKIGEAHSEGVDYIEDMLRKQLVAAIGKEVTPEDFSNYLDFHYRKIFRAEFRPRAFCHAIRRPDHYPEGTLSIEAEPRNSGDIANPINTIVSVSQATSPMRFPINASTDISFFGDRYLHGFVSHEFSNYSSLKLNLAARARQFSSFILLVGRIASADLFEPKFGIIIQNKDDLKIPLLLETIPTPKQFKDAIESLSPEQQRFAKAYRAMQLESTLFAICVIQIKPQLEKLLKIPDDSLTKEIQLTQDLLNLFIKYQIPSDLISYDGPENETPASKIGRVKKYVGNMLTLIQKAKDAELEEARQAQLQRIAENDRLAAEMAARESMRQRESESVLAMAKSSRRSKSALLSIEDESFTRTTSEAPKKEKANLFSRASAAPVRSSQPLRDISMSAPPPPAAARASVASAPPPAAVAPPPPAALSTTTTSVQSAEPKSTPDAPVPPVDQQQNRDLVKFGDVAKSKDLGIVDYTKIPTEIESKFEALDENNSLHSTIINTGPNWTKKFQKTLLGEPQTSNLNSDDQKTEKNQAFDLLDALTKSGAIPIEQASLHVVIASTHCFDKTLINTLIEDNINPIERVENSALIIASTIHRCTAAEMVLADHIDRISSHSPLLFESHNPELLLSGGVEASVPVSNNNNQP